MKASPIDHGWTLRLDPRRHRPEQATDALVDEGVPARVPGCAHTDLLAAGLIPDPYLGRNEETVAWVGRADWTYRTTLAGGSGDGYERADLVFDGLDTVAEVRMGGRTLGRTRNMHRAYRFDATEALAAGGSVPLEVAFTSAYEEAEAVRERLGPRPNAYPEPFNFVRKMASSFGWDWGPTLVTAGIWRRARLERWSLARLADVRPEVTVGEDGTGRLRVRIAVERTAGGAARTLRAAVRIAGAGTTAWLPPGSDVATVLVEVPDVALWWPRGYGEQPLYDCVVTLGTDDGEGAALDSWERRVGFRTVALDTAGDAEGSAFTLRVNGQPVFARGVNWIPDDTLVSRVDAARYRRRLGQAAAAGVNLVRVWGGGIYESEDFYDACDEAGLLVWQDFLFACAAYPEEEPLRSEVEAEARENVVRLMPHPSLVLWNGNNENLWGFSDWGWAEELNGASWGEGYYLGLLPRVVAETDPTRPYWAGSPWSGSPERHPNDPRHGTTHSWEVWNRLDYAAYRDDVPRFMAEFGWQAPPAYATLRRALGTDQLAPDAPDMLHHQKAEGGNGKLARGLAAHFDAPGDFDTWHYLTQLNQARAVATGIEHWRAHWPVCAGTVLWQLNDCWPVTSWAAIDGDEREKPLYHELRRLYADRLLSLVERDGRLALAVVNDAATPWEGRARIRRLDAKGGGPEAYEREFSAAARAVRLVELPLALTEFGDPAREFLLADATTPTGEDLRAFHFAAPDKEFAYPAAEVRTQVVATADGADVTVTAHTLVRDLLLQADRLAPTATADRGLVTLLPGESVTYRVSGWDGREAGAADGALWWVGKGARVAG